MKREIVATNSAQLFCLLSAVTNAFSLGQRRPGAQGSGAAGTGARGSDSTGRGDYTTDINDALLSRSKSVASMFALLSGNYATKLLLIKTGFFHDKNSLHLDALDAWTRQRLPAFRLGCACQQGKCIHEICDERATRMLVDRDGILGRHTSPAACRTASHWPFSAFQLPFSLQSGQRSRTALFLSSNAEAARTAVHAAEDLFHKSCQIVCVRGFF